MLRFNGAWRFEAPQDGKFRNRAIGEEAIADFRELIRKMSTQGDRWDTLEHFKGAFCGAVGSSHVRSSNESWAETDLDGYMQDAAQNAPLFLEAFFEPRSQVDHILQVNLVERREDRRRVLGLHEALGDLATDFAHRLAPDRAVGCGCRPQRRGRFSDHGLLAR